MTYEEFKQLAEHPQHRDVPAIFKLEVLETEELEEKKRSHYPKYKVNTYCPQAFTTTLEEAERLMHQDVQYRKKMIAASYPFVDLPSGDTLRCKLFPADKFHKIRYLFDRR